MIHKKRSLILVSDGQAKICTKFKFSLQADRKAAPKARRDHCHSDTSQISRARRKRCTCTFARLQLQENTAINILDAFLELDATQSMVETRMMCEPGSICGPAFCRLLASSLMQHIHPTFLHHEERPFHVQVYDTIIIFARGGMLQILHRHDTRIRHQIMDLPKPFDRLHRGDTGGRRGDRAGSGPCWGGNWCSRRCLT